MLKHFKDNNDNLHAIEEGFEDRLPSGLTEITEDEAETVRAGKLPPPPTLEQYKTYASISVDLKAENSRNLFITPGSGQALIYARKADEMQRFSVDPLDGNLPFMDGRALRKGTDRSTVAAEWQVEVDFWNGIAVNIEDLREDAKERIDLALDEAEVDIIVTSLVLPSPV